jgi:hypothetical protein
MSTFKKKYIWSGIIAVFVMYLLYKTITHFVIASQLEAVEGNPDFPTTELLSITEDRITAQSVIYNKKKLVEYYCCIDSFYSLNVVKVGTIQDSSNFFKSIHFVTKEQFPVDNTSSYFKGILPFQSYHFTDFISSYDVRLLPNLDVKSINILLDGQLLKQDTLTNHVLSYAIQTSFVSFEFNHSHERSMSSSSFHSLQNDLGKHIALPISKLVFYRTADNILYIMNISTVDDSEPDISNILKVI